MLPPFPQNTSTLSGMQYEGVNGAQSGQESIKVGPARVAE